MQSGRQEGLAVSKSTSRSCPMPPGTAHSGWLFIYCSALLKRRQLGVDTSRDRGCFQVSTPMCRRPVGVSPSGKCPSTRALWPRIWLISLCPIPDHERERLAASRERERRRHPTQLSRLPSQSFSYGDFPSAVGYPSIDLAPCVAPGSQCHGRARGRLSASGVRLTHPCGAWARSTRERTHAPHKESRKLKSP
jgi:hypothetical protein